MHKASAYLLFLCDMGNWSLTRLLGYMFTKSLCRPFISAAGAISFCEWSATPRTTKSSFVQDQRDLIPPKPDISFHTLACIMDLATLFSTSGAGFTLFSCSHLYLDAFICSDALAQDLEFGQIQRDDDPLVWFALFCSLPISAMLVWHHLSFVRFGLVFLFHPTKDKLIRLYSDWWYTEERSARRERVDEIRRCEPEGTEIPRFDKSHSRRV